MLVFSVAVAIMTKTTIFPLVLQKFLQLYSAINAGPLRPFKSGHQPIQSTWGRGAVRSVRLRLLSRSQLRSLRVRPRWRALFFTVGSKALHANQPPSFRSNLLNRVEE